MSPSNEVNDVLEDYKESEIERGFSEKLRNINRKLVQKNQKIKDLKILKSGRETYILNSGEKFKCIIKTVEEVENIILKFSLKDEKKLEIYSKNIEEENNHYLIKINIGPLYLDESRYNISVRSGDKSLIDNIKINVRNGDKKFGDHILLKDPANDKRFPHGRFYGFGNVDQIIEKYESGKSIYIYTDYIDGTKIEENFTDAKIIDGK